MIARPSDDFNCSVLLFLNRTIESFHSAISDRAAEVKIRLYSVA